MRAADNARALVDIPAPSIPDERQRDLFTAAPPDDGVITVSDKLSQRSRSTHPTSVPSGAARPTTLWECLQFLETCSGLPGSLRDDARSAVSTIERMVENPEGSKRRWVCSGTPVGTGLPADPTQLRPILDRIRPVPHGLTPARLSKIRSTINVMLKHCGWIDPAFWAGRPYAPAYEPLWREARQHLRQQAGPLGPAFRYWHAQGLQPEDVRPEHLAAYVAHRVENSLRRSSRSIGLNTASAWNRMIAVSPAWPRTRLHLPSIREPRKAPRIAELLPEVQAELASYLERLATANDRRDNGTRPLSASSLEGLRRHLLRAIGCLQARGLSLEQFDRLSLLTEPDNVETVLQVLWEEFGNTWSVTACNVAHALRTLARRWVQPAPAEFEELQRILRHVKGERGLSTRNLERLEQYDTDEARRALLSLPGKILETMQDMIRRDGRVGVHAAKLSEAALLLEILFTQPIRRRNLAALSSHHFRRDERGVIQQIRLPRQETKTRNRHIIIKVSQELARRIDWHWKHCRPFLLFGSSADLPYLFVGPNGNARRASTLGKSITRRVAAELGKDFTPHLARHLLVSILLEQDPNNLAVASRLLNHASTQITGEIYGVLLTGSAQGVWENVADDLRNKEIRREKRQRKKRT